MPARDAHIPSFSVGFDSWAPRRHLLLLARVPPDYIFFCGGAKAPRTAGFDHMAPLSDTIRCTDPLPMPHGGSRLRSLRHPWSMGAMGARSTRPTIVFYILFEQDPYCSKSNNSVLQSRSTLLYIGHRSHVDLSYYFIDVLIR